MSDYDSWKCASPDDYHEPPERDPEPTEEELEAWWRKLRKHAAEQSAAGE